MTRIDLRYPLVILAFYVPWALIMIGSWAIGYSTEEAREGVAVFGSIFGGYASVQMIIEMFRDRTPIWWEFRNGGRDG